MSKTDNATLWLGLAVVAVAAVGGVWIGSVMGASSHKSPQMGKSGADANAGTPITAQVVSANNTASTLTLHAANLPKPDTDGTQTVTVSSCDAAIGYVDRIITGDLSQSAGTWRLDNIWPADPANKAATDEATAQLRRDSIELGRKAYRSVGDNIPDFALYNQDGQLVRPKSLLGKRLVLDVIYTRCPFPDKCPASTHHMVDLQKALKDAGINDVTFVSITFDPEHDSPGVFRQYGQAYGIDFSNYQLLTGPLDETKELMKQLGIILQQTDGVLQHTMAEMIISPEGRILYCNNTSEWRVDEFLDRLKPAQAKSN